jgi:Na+/H+-translocating membrane pyrophosphatase
MDLAQEMVMGTEYYARKAVIRNDLKAGLNTLDKMMAETRSETTAQLNSELATIRVFIIIVAVLLLIIIGLSACLGTIPLIRAAKCAQNGEAVPVVGAKEFRYLASSYNKLTGAKEKDAEDDD